MITSWKAFTIQMESDGDISRRKAMVGKATLQMVPSRTDRNRPQNVVITA